MTVNQAIEELKKVSYRGYGDTSLRNEEETNTTVTDFIIKADDEGEELVLVRYMEVNYENN